MRWVIKILHRLFLHSWGNNLWDDTWWHKNCLRKSISGLSQLSYLNLQWCRRLYLNCAWQLFHEINHFRCFRWIWGTHPCLEPLQPTCQASQGSHQTWVRRSRSWRITSRCPTRRLTRMAMISSPWTSKFYMLLPFLHQNFPASKVC